MPAANRVVVHIEHPRHLLAAQPVVEKQERIGPARDAMLLGRTPNQRLQMRPLIAGKKTPTDHDRSRIEIDPPVNPSIRKIRESGYNGENLDAHTMHNACTKHMRAVCARPEVIP